MTFFPYTIKILAALGFSIPTATSYAAPGESHLPVASFNGVQRDDGVCAVVVATSSGKVAAASTFKSVGVTVYDAVGDGEEIVPFVVPVFPYSIFDTRPRRLEEVITFNTNVTITHSTWQDFGQATVTLKQPKWAVTTVYSCDPNTCSCTRQDA